MIQNIFRLLFIVLLSSVSLYSQSNKPTLEVEEMQHDFGEIVEGVIVTHDFVLKNSGTADLVIERVRASCGCTAAQPDKEELMPGESTTVRVSFNSAHRKGQQKKYVYVFTNDPDNPDVRLTFTADILEKESDKKLSGKPEIKLEKTYHNFGDAKEGTLLSLDLGIRNTGEDNLHLRRIEASCGCTTTMLSKAMLEPGESTKLRIDFDTSNRFGKITRTVSIFSDDPSNPEKTITLFVNILRQ